MIENLGDVDCFFKFKLTQNFSIREEAPIIEEFYKKTFESVMPLLTTALLISHCTEIY
jgi:hypothetical protein